MNHAKASPGIRVDLGEAIRRLTEALNLVGIDEHQHGERVAFMAVETARMLAWDDTRLTNLFHASLLHDCGVSSSRVHTKLVSELDWSGSERHCHIGEAYLLACRPLAHLAPIIRWHHTHWDVLNSQDGLDPDMVLTSNLIYLADRADALLAQYRAQGDEAPYSRIRERLLELSGTFFAPELLGAFMHCSRGEAFWLALEPLDVAEYVARFDSHLLAKAADARDLLDLAKIFAHIVDAKSPYTYQHSRGVACLSTYLARIDGMPEERVALIEVAGLLHDLGKLGVPDEILESPEPLSKESMAIMHRHSYHSYRILQGIRGLEEVASWAGSHHETLLGDGYPFQYDSTRLPREARIIAVADVFQALAQDRPYRKGLPMEEVLAVLLKMRDSGRLDAGIVAMVEADLDGCYRAALPAASDGLPWDDQG